MTTNGQLASCILSAVVGFGIGIGFAISTEKNNNTYHPATIVQTTVDGTNYNIVSDGFSRKFVFTQTGSNSWERTDLVAQRQYEQKKQSTDLQYQEAKGSMSNLTQRVLSSTQGGGK